MITGSQTQKHIDRLVVIFGAALLIGLISTLIANKFLMFLTVPVCAGTLLYLSVTDLPNQNRKRTAYTVLHIFNVISLAIWFTAWIFIDYTDQWIAGLPISSAILFVFGWPFYAITSGLMYAYIARIGGILQRQEAEDTEGTLT